MKILAVIALASIVLASIVAFLIKKLIVDPIEEKEYLKRWNRFPRVLHSGFDGSTYVLLDKHTRFDIHYRHGDVYSEIWAERRGVDGEVFKDEAPFKVLEFSESENAKWCLTHSFNGIMLDAMVGRMKDYLRTNPAES